jgi:hypothetical protein
VQYPVASQDVTAVGGTTLTQDPADPSISQPGLYTAALDIGNDTPYQVPAVAVRVEVQG